MFLINRTRRAPPRLARHEIGTRRLGDRVRILAPEVLLAARDALHPGRQGAAGDAPRPRVLELLVLGHEAAVGGALEEPDDRVDEDVQQYARDEAVGDAVGERHGDNGDEGRDRVAHVLPVDVDSRGHHHRAYQYQNAARGPRRDGGEDGREEDGYEKADARRHGCQAGASAVGYAGAGFDEGGHGRAPE